MADDFFDGHFGAFADGGVFSLFFLGPSSPMPTFGSPGPPNNFKANGLACLGELTASGLSFSSHGRVATAPRWPFSYK